MLMGNPAAMTIKYDFFTFVDIPIVEVIGEFSGIPWFNLLFTIF